MFSTSDLSVDIVMVTIKKQDGEDPRAVWFNGNILVLTVTSHQEPPKLRPSRLCGNDPILGGEQAGGACLLREQEQVLYQAVLFSVSSFSPGESGHKFSTSGCHHLFGHLIFDKR